MPSLRRQGTIILETWIPPYQVRGRLSQARNDKPYKTYVVMYNVENLEREMKFLRRGPFSGTRPYRLFQVGLQDGISEWAVPVV